MGAVLALASATCFGIADFVGGLLSRRANSSSVALIGQVAGGIVVLVVAPLAAASHVDLPSLGWGALSGVGTGVGVLFLYRGLVKGQMCVVVPLSTVGGVALSVLAGVLFLGDRPSPLASAGIVVAVPALWLVSASRGQSGSTAAGTVDGLVSGVGFALQNVALPHADADAGLWPVAASRVASVLVILSLTRPAVTASWSRLSWRLGLLATGNGVMASAAITLYLFATRQELLSVAVVLSSLYPVIPVLLGLAVLREHLIRRQAAGLVTAGLAVVLLSSG